MAWVAIRAQVLSGLVVGCTGQGIAQCYSSHLSEQCLALYTRQPNRKGLERGWQPTPQLMTCFPPEPKTHHFISSSTFGPLRAAWRACGVRRGQAALLLCARSAAHAHVAFIYSNHSTVSDNRIIAQPPPRLLPPVLQQASSTELREHRNFWLTVTAARPFSCTEKFLW